MRLNKSG